MKTWRLHPGTIVDSFDSVALPGSRANLARYSTATAASRMAVLASRMAEPDFASGSLLP